jgi:hypothetical protein
MTLVNKIVFSQGLDIDNLRINMNEYRPPKYAVHTNELQTEMVESPFADN